MEKIGPCVRNAQRRCVKRPVLESRATPGEMASAPDIDWLDELESLPGDLPRFKLPAGVQARLQELLDRQDSGQPLTETERSEAEGLVTLADFLSLLRLRAERAAG